MQSFDDPIAAGAHAGEGAGSALSDEQASLAPDIVELLMRSATLHRGLAFVNTAPIDCVAVTLGVHAQTVDRTREHLGRGDVRKLVLREYARALEQHRSAPPPPVRPSAPSTRVSSDVIRDAYAHPLGVQFLLCAPLETAAITFSVHPDVVAEARGHLAERGVVPTDS